MAADKPRPTLADYVTIALSPALIVAMIASLVFFLVEILYRGEFAGRVQHILFFFIFGMVLVARISMETGIAERAPLYGAVLAFVVWLGMGSFINYPPGLEASSWLINAGLIALVWWLAYRLTYSCTHIDEQAEATGTGVLQAAGLDEAPKSRSREPSGTESAESAKGPARHAGPAWWQRYQRFRAQQKKKHTPGVWVVYFALAALPIYGLGQALIDVEDGDRRRFTLWLMALYVASSLGLLVTTSFLGLRRYLRQRKLQMPKAVTAGWLTAGAGLLAAFVLMGALLPRPQAEFSILNLTPASSKSRDASNYAMTRGDPGKGEGRAGAQERDAKGQPVDSKDPNREGQGGKGQAKGQGAGEKGEQKGNAQESEKQPQDGRDTQDKQDKQNTRESSAESKSAKQSPAGAKSESRSWSGPAWLSKIAGVVKWIVFAFLAVVVLVFLLRGGLRYLANFCNWARRLLDALRRFWEGLFGGRRETVAEKSDAELSPATRRLTRLFSNPFLDGRADGMLPADLVRYSFEALEAWAEDRQLARGTEETPIEFANRIAVEVPALELEVKQLGMLYARVLYARAALPPSWRGAVEKFWQRLEAVPVGRREPVHAPAAT